MRLVYVSPVSWSSFSQRPHHFVRWFHKRTGADVIWIEPYPARFPKFRDLRRLKRQEEMVCRESPSWIRVVRPGALPIEPLPFSDRLNYRLFWQHFVKDIKDAVRGNQVWLVIGKPCKLSLLLLDRFQGSPSLYDAMDDFPAFHGGLSRRTMAAIEVKIVRQAEEVWASSTALKQRWQAIKSGVHLVYNGLDASSLPMHSAPAQCSGTRVFGYVGTMATWFDWEWVAALAHARSGDKVRLVGPVYQVAPFRLPENVELLPPCDHASALRFMQEFDVGLIPFRLNKLTDSVDPIKYYEYRALGKPIISTPFGEMRYRSSTNGVFLCERTADLASVATRALSLQFNLEETLGFIEANSWLSRFDSSGLIRASK